MNNETLRNLTYNYEEFSKREETYLKTINKFDKSLLAQTSHLEKIEQRGQSYTLKTDGYCDLSRLDSSSCKLLSDKYFGRTSSDRAKQSIDNTILVSDKMILELFSHPKIIKPIKEYLGIFPSIQNVAAWKNVGPLVPERTNEMYWHMDHHGHRFIKAFYYLNDVKFGYGHHQYITKTHIQDLFDRELKEGGSPFSHLRDEISRKRRLRGRHKIQDDSLWPLASRIKNMHGARGMGFAEDTRGLHRGTPLPPSWTREILQCLYVAFPSGKDPSHKSNLSEVDFENIRKRYKYTRTEMNKLTALIRG